MDNATVAMLIKMVLGLLGVFAAAFLIKYRLTLSKIIALVVAVQKLTDEDTTPEEVEELKKAWNELKEVLKNYSGMKNYLK